VVERGFAIFKKLFVRSLEIPEQNRRQWVWAVYDWCDYISESCLAAHFDGTNDYHEISKDPCCTIPDCSINICYAAEICNQLAGLQEHHLVQHESLCSVVRCFWRHGRSRHLRTSNELRCPLSFSSSM
jgi:hypothetical protein